MKCRKCGSAAVINLRQHRLSLCKEHFNDWFIQHCASTIKKFDMIKPGDRILVAVSGGKDSLGLWDVLLKLGYKADGLIINLGIDAGSEYSARSLEITCKFCGENGQNLHVLDIQKEYGGSVSHFFTRAHPDDQKPCSTCGLVKRHELNRVAKDNGYTTLATGHNLDDEAAVLFSNSLSWNTSQLLRQDPVMEEYGQFVRRIKPLVQFYERETTAYAILNGIEYIEEECPFSTGSKTNYHKTILNKMENEQPGLKYQFYRSFIEKKKTGLLKISENRPYEEHYCQICGQPTSSEGKCAFCRMLEGMDQAVSR